MPVAVILTVAKSIAGGLLGFARTWLGGVIIAFAFAWVWSGWRHDDACNGREAARRAAMEAASRAEHSRREEAIAKARDEADAAARALAAQETDREKILRESENASHKDSGGACLSAAGVMRLNKLR